MISHTHTSESGLERFICAGLTDSVCGPAAAHPVEVLHRALA